MIVKDLSSKGTRKFFTTEIHSPNIHFYSIFSDLVLHLCLVLKIGHSVLGRRDLINLDLETFGLRICCKVGTGRHQVWQDGYMKDVVEG